MMQADNLRNLINVPIKYFYTPIERLMEKNEAGIDRLENKSSTNKSKPKSNEEQPQLVFHTTAKARFDRKDVSIVQMLQKLKIKGSWNKANATYPLPKDYNYHPYTIEDEVSFSSSSGDDIKGMSDVDDTFSSFRKDDFETPAVGWITGLVSSESDLGTRREVSEREGLAMLCRSLDVQAVNQIHNKLDGNNLEIERNVSSYIFYNERILEKEASKAKKDELSSSFDRLIGRLVGVANSLMSHNPRSVAAFQSDSTIFGLAYELTGEVKYAKQAAENIRSWFLNPGSRLHQMVSTDDFDSGDLKDSSTLGSLAFEPTVNGKYDSQAVGKKRFWISEAERLRLSIVDFKDAAEFLEVTTVEPSVKFSDDDDHTVSKFAASDFNDLHFFLDAVKMVEKSGELSELEIAGVRDWFRRYLELLVTPEGDFGNAAYYENDLRGLNFDIQVISVAAFTGNQSLAVRIAHESVSRLIGHAHKFDRAVRSGNGDCDLILVLQGWMTLSRIVSNYLGIHLWKQLPLKRSLSEYNSQSKETKNQPFLCRAPEYAVLLSERDQTSCTAQDSHDEIDSTRWLPIHWTVQHWDCPAPWKISEDGLSHYAEQPMHGVSSFGNYRNHGIAPFWNLGLA